MKKVLLKFWHWLRCEDENGNPVDNPWQNLRYSEMIKYNALDGKIGDEDILKLSHKKEDGQYQTCYVTIKQLKECLKA